jgi:hypothetical protein
MSVINSETAGTRSREQPSQDLVEKQRKDTAGMRACQWSVASMYASQSRHDHELFDLHHVNQRQLNEYRKYDVDLET